MTPPLLTAAAEEKSVTQPSEREEDVSELLASERRGNPRQETFAIFTMRFPEGTVLGTGRNISRSGGYFVSSDEVHVEVLYEKDGVEHRAPARLVRADTIAPGTTGYAVEFSPRLAEGDLPA